MSSTRSVHGQPSPHRRTRLRRCAPAAEHGRVDVVNAVAELGQVAATHELHALGFTRADLATAVRSRALIRVRQGWYLSPHVKAETREALRVGGRITCVSALRLAGFWTPSPTVLHVAVRRTDGRLRARNDKRQLLVAGTVRVALGEPGGRHQAHCRAYRRVAARRRVPSARVGRGVRQLGAPATRRPGRRMAGRGVARTDSRPRGPPDRRRRRASPASSTCSGCGCDALDRAASGGHPADRTRRLRRRRRPRRRGGRTRVPRRRAAVRSGPRARRRPQRGRLPRAPLLLPAGHVRLARRARSRPRRHHSAATTAEARQPGLQCRNTSRGAESEAAEQGATWVCSCIWSRRRRTRGGRART